MGYTGAVSHSARKEEADGISNEISARVRPLMERRFNLMAFSNTDVGYIETRLELT